jgi:hypothetical protein
LLRVLRVAILIIQSHELNIDSLAADTSFFVEKDGFEIKESVSRLSAQFNDIKQQRVAILSGLKYFLPESIRCTGILFDYLGKCIVQHVGSSAKALPVVGLSLILLPLELSCLHLQPEKVANEVLYMSEVLVSHRLLDIMHVGVSLSRGDDKSNSSSSSSSYKCMIDKIGEATGMTQGLRLLSLALWKIDNGIDLSNGVDDICNICCTVYLDHALVCAVANRLVAWAISAASSTSASEISQASSRFILHFWAILSNNSEDDITPILLLASSFLAVNSWEVQNNTDYQGT